VLRGLGDRAHRHEVEVDVAGRVQRVRDDVGDIVGDQRVLDAVVDLLGRRCRRRVG
jgi:hypothetical protein